MGERGELLLRGAAFGGGVFRTREKLSSGAKAPFDMPGGMSELKLRPPKRQEFFCNDEIELGLSLTGMLGEEDGEEQADPSLRSG